MVYAILYDSVQPLFIMTCTLTHPIEITTDNLHTQNLNRRAYIKRIYQRPKNQRRKKIRLLIIPASWHTEEGRRPVFFYNVVVVVMLHEWVCSLFQPLYTRRLCVVHNFDAIVRVNKTVGN